MLATADIPRTGFPDLTFAMLCDGYEFIGKRCRRYGPDAFRTSLMLADVVCMTGPDAAKLFYGGGRFTRRRAMPAPVLKLLQDRESVQWLDDQVHQQRKQMFMAMLRGRSRAGESVGG